MNGYAVAHLDAIEELSDGRCPWRPVRHHFGITSFGVNAWTAASMSNPPHRTALPATMPPIDTTAISLVPPPMSTIRFP